MIAAVPPLTSPPRSISEGARPNRLPGAPIIHTELDAAGLTIEAYRVYCHLSCHARPTFVDGAVHWAVCRSLNRIATECFGSSYPNTTEQVLRRKVADSVKELLDRKMMVRQRHQPGVTLANLYLLLPMECWQVPTADFKNSNIRKGRGSRKPATDPPTIAPNQATDPPRITLIPSIDPPTIYLDRTQKVTADTLLEAPSTIYRSSQDQDLYIVNRGIYTSSKERERESRKYFFSKNKQPEQDEYSVAAIVKTAQADEKSADHPQTQEQDAKCSAAVGASEKANFPNFDASAYDWTRYDRAGDGGSHSSFWEYVLRRTQNYSDRQKKAGRKPVLNLFSFALERVHLEGESLYHDFEIEQGWREAPPKPPKPTPQRSQPVKPPVSQPADPIAQWQKISDNLNLRPPDMLLSALEQELRHISPNTTAKDAVERMQWLLSANPQWGYVLKDGKICPLVSLVEEQADLTDLLLEVKWRFQELSFDRSARSQWLQERYNTTLQAMSGQQLAECLADLQTFNREQT
ncbi:MAG: hypothetical protein KME11_05235 [Timaviella obliquedivisa GSE-PSE-MK23-08B]|jgi:hypothetical protein|nr:hypothetical protein [Timaviella obliquedivisa GSE-PSE-MK23-08B]